MLLAEALSLHAFADPTGETGRIVYDLGNAYQHTNLGVLHSTVPYRLMIKQRMVGWRQMEVEARQLHESLGYVANITPRWSQARPGGADASLVLDEFANNVAMWEHGCRCGLALLEEKEGRQPNWAALAAELPAIVTEHHRLWLARHRPGGLVDSAASLSSRLPYYLTRLDT
jgi:hypothetical protein